VCCVLVFRAGLTSSTVICSLQMTAPATESSNTLASSTKQQQHGIATAQGIDQPVKQSASAAARTTRIEGFTSHTYSSTTHNSTAAAAAGAVLVCCFMHQSTLHMMSHASHSC
jgi:hypothetical protein